MRRLMEKGLVFVCLACVAAALVVSDGAQASEKDPTEKTDTPYVQAASGQLRDAEYVLGPGDVLEITTWKDESLSKVVPILPDGKIHFPLIGSVGAAGKTVDGLKNEIERSISKYVSDPYVTVSVQQVNSMMIYIVGKVNQPGRFLLNTNVNVLQALAMAGGLNTFANGDNIKIIREGDDGQTVIKFDYDKAAKGKDLSENIFLSRGDIIVVP